MATEPTLGTRILDAAEEWNNSVLARIEARKVGEGTLGHDVGVVEDLATLRALAARADAAEEGDRRGRRLRARVTGALPSGSHLVPGFAVNAYDTGLRAAADSLPVCRWAKQGAEPRMTSCGHNIDWYLGGEICPECGGRIVESEVPS